MSGLVFRGDTHQYFLDGRELPGITRILRGVGIIDIDEDDPTIIYAAERGRAVHEATALDDREELDEETVDPVVRPYLEAWRRFRAESNFRPEPWLIEVPLARADLGYAGTPDRGGWLGRDAIVLEIKATAQIRRSVGLQLAAQQLLFWKAHPIKGGALFPALKRYAVQLRPDGSYRLQEFKGPEDRSVFLAALRVHQWKQKEGD